jgi:prophage regulatory protein
MDNDPDDSTPRTSVPLSPATRVLRLKEVCSVTGLRRSFIYKLQSEKRFPHSIKIGARAVGWLENEVRDWINGRVRFSRPRA